MKKVMELIAWGDDITHRLDELIEKARPTPEEEARYKRLCELNLKAQQEDKQKKEDREALAQVLGDFLTQDRSGERTEQALRKLDNRGRG